MLASLGGGILVAGLLIADFNPLTVVEAILGLVWADDAVNWYTILIVAFFFQLGIITALIAPSFWCASNYCAFSENPNVRTAVVKSGDRLSLTKMRITSTDFQAGLALRLI